METKQVIVIRKDLNMRKGKMIAQGCHASMKVLIDVLDVSVWEDTHTHFERYLPHDDPLCQWLIGTFTKVVVGCESEQELLALKAKADIMEIRNAIIQDVGKTEFKGVPTFTALAIGPDYIEKINKITGHLKLL